MNVSFLKFLLCELAAFNALPCFLRDFFVLSEKAAQHCRPKGESLQSLPTVIGEKDCLLAKIFKKRWNTWKHSHTFLSDDFFKKLETVAWLRTRTQIFKHFTSLTQLSDKNHSRILEHSEAFRWHNYLNKLRLVSLSPHDLSRLEEITCRRLQWAASNARPKLYLIFQVRLQCPEATLLWTPPKPPQILHCVSVAEESLRCLTMHRVNIRWQIYTQRGITASLFLKYDETTYFDNVCCFFLLFLESTFCISSTPLFTS